MHARHKIIAGFFLVTMFFGASVMADVMQVGENIKYQSTTKYRA